MAYRSQLSQDSSLHLIKREHDFLDCFSVDLFHETRPLSDLAQTTFIELSTWIQALLAIRDTAVSIKGLKTTRGLPKDLSFRDTLHVGDKINFLTILSLSEHEIILGEDDKHLDFRISFRVDESDPRRISLATLVHAHNLYGRVYLKLILPFHNRIVRSRLDALR
jgi:hypothetical protein